METNLYFQGYTLAAKALGCLFPVGLADKFSKFLKLVIGPIKLTTFGYFE